MHHFLGCENAVAVGNYLSNTTLTLLVRPAAESRTMYVPEATLECELLDRHSFRTQTEARLAIFEFIEGWYNPHRRHSALDYESPISYERRYQTTAC